MIRVLRKSTVRPLAVGEAAVVQHLEQHIEDVGVGLFHLVEEHDLVGPAADGFGERAAFVVADVAGRRADHPADRVLFHIFASMSIRVMACLRRRRGVPANALVSLVLPSAGGAQEEE